MSATIKARTVTTITMTTEDLPFDAVLEHEPVEWIDPVVTQREDGTFTVAYAVLDEYPDTDLDFVLGDGAQFEEFRTEWDRDDYFNATDLTTHVPFVVDHFEHGSSIYSLANAREGTADFQWDSRPSCVLRVPVDFTDHREAAAAMLTGYTSWVNGDIYLLVRQDFTAIGEEASPTEIVGGYIGTGYTEEAVSDIDAHL